MCNKISKEKKKTVGQKINADNWEKVMWESDRVEQSRYQPFLSAETHMRVAYIWRCTEDKWWLLHSKEWVRKCVPNTAELEIIYVEWQWWMLKVVQGNCLGQSLDMFHVLSYCVICSVLRGLNHHCLWRQRLLLLLGLEGRRWECCNIHGAHLKDKDL